MKKILMSLTTISAMAALVVGATGAFFSDVETSAGNTFEAGGLDLAIDLEGSWQNPWVGPFFSGSDMKPGDQVEKTISLHVDNDAWLCLGVDQISDNDNGCSEPEDVEDASCDNPGTNQGELSDNLEVLIWWDDGLIDGWQCSPRLGPRCPEDLSEGDNVYQEEHEVIYYNELANGLAAFIAANPGPWPLTASTDYYVGIKACVGDLDPTTFTCNGADVTNVSQTDDWGADVSFYVEQQRNNSDFICPSEI